MDHMTHMYFELPLLLMVGIAAGTDLISRRIPNALVAAGMTVSFMLHLFVPDAAGIGAWALGALTGFALFLPFYAMRGMAAGDVKLMAAVGAFAGPLLAFKIALAVFLIGGAWALIVIVLKGRGRAALMNLAMLVLPLLMRTAGMETRRNGMPQQSVGRLPYGIAIFLGSAALLGSQHSQWLGKIAG